MGSNFRNAATPGSGFSCRELRQKTATVGQISEERSDVIFKPGTGRPNTGEKVAESNPVCGGASQVGRRCGWIWFQTNVEPDRQGYSTTAAAGEGHAKSTLINKAVLGGCSSSRQTLRNYSFPPAPAAAACRRLKWSGHQHRGFSRHMTEIRSRVSWGGGIKCFHRSTGGDKCLCVDVKAAAAMLPSADRGSALQTSQLLC